jgi:uncharacterized membrane protein YccF (DUF307 family)
MRFISNIIWFIFGCCELGLAWVLAGALCCVTIIGIPVGIQAFKIALLAFWPFGRTVNYDGGAGSLLLNIIWIILGGLALAVGHLVTGLLYCVTIIGIPFGIQNFKLAKLALMPFGATIS